MGTNFVLKEFSCRYGLRRIEIYNYDSVKMHELYCIVWCYSELISTSGKMKNMPDHDGNRTYDLWNADPMFCQLSHAVRSVQVCDISKLSLVPSIST